MSLIEIAPRMAFGAAPVDRTTTRFRFWAPALQSVTLEVEGLEPTAMRKLDDGWFEAEASCGAGAAYRFRVGDDLAVVDPAARELRGGVFGHAVVTDPHSYRWRNAEWKGRPWTDCVFYELHVGAFGGYSGVTSALPRLAELGITAVELMPISAFPGDLNWGYDGVLPYAPHPSYGAPDELSALGSTPAHAELFARAIMTTDTKMKVARAVIDIESPEAPSAISSPSRAAQVRIFGVAKGAGMIHPQLGEPVAPPHATMLVYLFTDLAAAPAELALLLAPAADSSFNSISIDGDTSTNDTVLLIASGASGIRLDDRVGEAFANALSLVCSSLAHQIIDDGEGVTHVINLHITGTRTVAEARQIAKTIAHSPLCKTAWSSGDPNWGRLLAAAGYSGVAFDSQSVALWIGPHLVLSNGLRAPGYDEAAAHHTMLEREYTIRLDLGQGSAECNFLTCDLTAEYVSINADYSS